MTQTPHKLDVFECLRQIDAKNIEFYDKLPTTSQKGFYPVVVTRWVYGSPHNLQIMLLNEAVNPYMFVLGKHPGLLFKLLTTTTVAKTKYKWKAKHQETSRPVSIKIIADYYNISKREAKLHLNNFTVDDLTEMCNDMGYQIEEIKKLKLEFKKL